MSNHRRALVLAAMVAAMNLAGITAIAHANDQLTSDQHARRPPTQAQVGETYRHDPDALAAQGSSGDAVERFRQSERASQEQNRTAEAVEEFRRSERASQQQNITDDATQQKLAERWNYYNQATRMSPAELKAWMEAKQLADNPTQLPAPLQPDQPTEQPGWLVAALTVLAAVLAMVAALAVLAARRATRRARVGPAT
jgi:hypothetical protein